MEESNSNTRTASKQLIGSEYFRNLLSEDLTIQIGKYIFRVNPETKKVYTLLVSNKNQYSDLIAENTANKNIRVFSTDDEVLELIQNEDKGNTRPLICKESGIAERWENTDDIPIAGNNIFKVRCVVRFEKWGIYFNLAAAALGTSSPSIGQLRLDIVPVYYHVRCGETVGPNYYTDYYEGQGGYDIKYQSYQGGKNLNKVWLKARAIAVLNPGQPNEVKTWTPYVEIRVNY